VSTSSEISPLRQSVKTLRDTVKKVGKNRGKNSGRETKRESRRKRERGSERERGMQGEQFGYAGRERKSEGGLIGYAE
jgi:hypothetical protein